MDAIACAEQLSKTKGLTVAQVVRTGQFLVGNLGDAMVRAFNVVGPLQVAAQQMMLHAPATVSTVLITATEKAHAQYSNSCLPFLQLKTDQSKSETVYCMLPAKDAADDEWMYTIEEAVGEQSAEGCVQLCWDAIAQGDLRTAQTRLEEIENPSVPAWYLAHLKQLIKRQQGVDRLAVPGSVN